MLRWRCNRQCWTGSRSVNTTVDSDSGAGGAAQNCPRREHYGINTELTEAYRAASCAAADLKKQMKGAATKTPAPHTKRGRSRYQTSSERDTSSSRDDSWLNYDPHTERRHRPTGSAYRPHRRRGRSPSRRRTPVIQGGSDVEHEENLDGCRDGEDREPKRNAEDPGRDHEDRDVDGARHRDRRRDRQEARHASDAIMTMGARRKLGTTPGHSSLGAVEPSHETSLGSRSHEPSELKIMKSTTERKTQSHTSKSLPRQ